MRSSRSIRRPDPWTGWDYAVSSIVVMIGVAAFLALVDLFIS